MRYGKWLIAIFCVSAGPAFSDEVWHCSNGATYRIASDYVGRDEPPLIFKLLQNNKFGTAAASIGVGKDYMGGEQIFFRKSDGMLFAFGVGIAGKGSKEASHPLYSMVYHCSEDKSAEAADEKKPASPEAPAPRAPGRAR